ncbi:MAG: hypothetical protein V4736_04840 [Bdellovibrionota bacterium]
MDGGDSASRNGMLATFDTRFTWMTSAFEPYFNGLCVRHPCQSPWSNPNNFTRDQLIPLVSGMHRNNEHSATKRIFWAHAKRFFLCQNIERDYKGISRKYPFPHRYREFDKNEIKFSFFDYRDPLMPDDIWHLARCAGFRWHWIVGIIGAPWLALTIFLTRRGEINSLLCKAKVAGPFFIRLVKKYIPHWEDLNRHYWSGWRDQAEIAEIIIKGFSQDSL